MPWIVLAAPGRPYLAWTLAALDAQGPALPRHVVSDGPLDADLPPGWTRHVHPHAGHPANLHRAFLLAAHLGGDPILLEDDVLPAPGAVHRVEAFPIPADLGFVQFLSASVAPGAPFGLYRPPMGIRLLQCLKFTADAVERLLHLPTPAGDPATWLTRAQRRLRLRHGVHDPDLFEHVGAISTYGHDLDRCRGTTWQGAPFDAADLAAWDARGDYA